jgi:hypothetical protein
MDQKRNNILYSLIKIKNLDKQIFRIFEPLKKIFYFGFVTLIFYN